MFRAINAGVNSYLKIEAPMSMNYPVWGEGYVPAYQVSSVPYVTSSTLSNGEIKTIEFGSVSKFLIIRNMGATSTAIAVGFTRAGLTQAKSNYFILSGSESFSAEIRTDRIFLSGSVSSTTFSVVAGLTAIPARSFTVLTESNGYPGVG